MTKTRLETFSDGVIAILITIMVLELKAPHGTSWKDLEPLWPVLLSYFISFLILASYWVNHHHLIHTIKEVSGGILWANLNLLFWLSLVPFLTAWMGETQFNNITVAIYSTLAILCGFAYYILLMVIKKNNPDNPVLLKVLVKQSRKGMFSCVLYAMAIGAAFINSIISGVLVILVFIMWLMPDKNIEKIVK